ncbi:MAG: hypothetical protein IJK34_00390, partial [Clostridia bacterium]|nr:hypothetical protein [Clostridia bacterium]
MKRKKLLTRKSLKKPLIKIIVLTVLSGILSVIVSSLGDFSREQPYFGYKVFLLLAFFLFYVFVLCKYEVFDINTRRAKAELEKYLNAYEVFFSQLSDSCKNSTTKINTCIK